MHNKIQKERKLTIKVQYKLVCIYYLMLKMLNCQDAVFLGLKFVILSKLNAYFSNLFYLNMCSGKTWQGLI